jgi:hypothetical protein
MSEPVLQIKNQIPFAEPIYGRIHLRNQPLDTLVKPSRQYETPYLAWETVRKLRNPFFVNGTGFEGYFIGICHSPDEALAAILRVNEELLKSISRLHGLDYSYKRRLMKTLTDDLDDPRAIAEWSALLGAALGKLRSNVRRCQPAESFQNETYRIVSRLPTINYEESRCAIAQHYIIGYCDCKGLKAHISLSDPKQSQQDAWLVACRIGRFGHPLVRQFLRLAQP